MERSEREQRALEAICYTLARARDDKKLGYHLGPMTEAWERLVKSAAELSGESEQTVRREFA